MEESRHLGESIIMQIGIKYINECCSGIRQDVYSALVQALCTYIHNPTEDNDKCAKDLFYSISGSAIPLSKVKEIIEIPINDCILDSDDNDYLKKKTKPWQKIEDIRLLSGIYKYGVNNWGLVSSFVGSGRTRSQCYQRWMRGLNPSISKDVWTFNEDMRLVELVTLYGDKSWTKVAQLLGSRSDVQCRYHYHQLKRDMPNLVAEFAKGNCIVPCQDQSLVTIQAPYNKKHSNRFSLPDIQIPSIFLEALRRPSIDAGTMQGTPLRKCVSNPVKHPIPSMRRPSLPILGKEEIRGLDDDQNLDNFLTHFV